MELYIRIGDFMRRLGRYRRKRQNKIILITAFSLLFIITAGYAAFSTNITFHAKGNIKEKSRIIQAWSNTDQTDFHSDYYKQNIVNVTFLDNNNVASNATESWNVSEDKNNGGVMAWVVPNNEDSTKYDLYIGAKDGVIANEDSRFLFFDFSNLEQIFFNNNFDTSNAINMISMFAGNSNFTTLDLSSFDTSNVTNMNGMFSFWNWNTHTAGTTVLSNIIFGDKFDTSNVIYMNDMFSGFKGKNLDVSNFDTSNVINMFHMFQGSRNLEVLNLCSFDTRKVTNMTGMFENNSNLKKITVGFNWSTTQATINQMFANSGVSSVTTGQC